MKTSAVICEYNPFHRGHEYQLSEMKKRGSVIAIMSGSFTQRGDAAVLSKYERAEIAVRCGADLVLELPFPYSSASAEIFGKAGVAIADSLGCVSELCFGSESGNTETLLKISQRTASPEFRASLDAYLAQNHAHTYRTSVSKIYQAFYGEEMPMGSNDILALSYLTALADRKSPMIPTTIRRIGESYNGAGEGFASASTIRSHIKNNNHEEISRLTPQVTAQALCKASENGRLADTGKLFPLFAAIARTRGIAAFTDIYDIPADLSARLCQYSVSARNTEELLSRCASKTYSPSRIRRAMLMTLLNVKKDEFSEVSYTTLLAANENGRKILSDIRKTSNIPIITKPADHEKYGEQIKKAFSLASRADRIWELLCENARDGGAMMREKPRMFYH